MKLDIAIITGWSNIGGSTESYINLTNALNDDGISTKLFGPHEWHLGKCSSGMHKEFSPFDVKNVIWHFQPMSNEMYKYLRTVNTISSCHEHKMNKVFERYNTSVFNYFHFVSEGQLQYHLGYSNYDKIDLIKVIPNLLDPKLKRKKRPIGNKKIGGVIGSFDRNKQTHISIKKAIEDGCDEVKLYGAITDPKYGQEVAHVIDGEIVQYCGVENDKNKMYGSVTDVYHYSINETWGYIKAECEFLGIPFHSNYTNTCVVESQADILNSWKEMLI